MRPALLALPVLASLATLAAAPDRAEAQTSCPNGPVHLSLLRPQNNPVFPAQIQAFEATEPCIRIDVSEVPFGQLADKINVLAASGSPPDLIVYDGPNTQTYASAGVLEPLDSYLPPGLKDDILPATLTEHSWNGKLYSPGLQQTTLALYYNADMVQKAGIPAPPRTLQDAWTWDQTMDAFRKCQQGNATDVSVWGLAPSRFGNGEPGAVYRDLLFLRTQGDPKAPKDSSQYRAYWSISPDGKTVQGWLNAPEAVAGAKFYQSMFDTAHITPKTGIPNAFQDGKACFTIDTSYIVGSLRQHDPGFHWGVTPLPYSHSPIVHTGSVTLGVTAKSQHKAEAVRFLLAVSTGKIAADYARSTGALPVMKSLYAGLPDLQQYPLSIFTDELREWGQPRPPSPHYAQFDKLVSDALRDIAFGADPQKRLDTAVRVLTPILAR